MDKIWSYGLAGALLGTGGVTLFYYREWNSIDPWYLGLILLGTAGMSFGVGWTLGHLTESGLVPGSGPGE